MSSVQITPLCNGSVVSMGRVMQKNISILSALAGKFLITPVTQRTLKPSGFYPHIIPGQTSSLNNQRIIYNK